MVNNYLTDPAAIESKSMQLIEQELGAAKGAFDPLQLAILKRVIHTTADFEYADLLVAPVEAIEAGIAALLKGEAQFIADTNMIAAGVNKNLLSLFKADLYCGVALAETRLIAEKEGLTRSMINIREAVKRSPRGIFVIGNAPTALYELLHQVEAKNAAPKLVIGVPVGFVEAAESKEALLDSRLPCFSVKGRKGGSTVAVAMVNALLKLAAARR